MKGQHKVHLLTQYVINSVFCGLGHILEDSNLSASYYLFSKNKQTIVTRWMERSSLLILASNLKSVQELIWQLQMVRYLV